MRKIITFCLVLCLAIMQTGCGHSDEALSPDDEISEFVCTELEGVFTYIEKSTLEDGTKSYTYLGWTSTFTKENMSLFLDSVSSLRVDDGDRIKINLAVEEAGGRTWVCTVSNYYPVAKNGAVEYVEYSEMCVFSIGWPPIYADEIHDPATYTVGEGIRYLFLDEKMEGIASDKGIDWYEIWPELEGVAIIDSSNWHN